MPDTVILQAPIKPDINRLRSVGFELIRKESPNGEIWQKLYLNCDIDGVPLGFTIYPPNPKFPNPILLIQMSFLTMLYGNNAVMLRNEADLLAAASMANKLLNDHFPWLSPIDVMQLVIQRIDFCYDHLAGMLVQGYLKVLLQQTMPHRKTFPFVERDFPEKTRLQGVEYRTMNGHNKAMFYDKYLECKRPEAIGLLRQEMKIYGPRTISARLGIIEYPTLQHVTIDKVTRLLESDLEKVGLKNTVATDLYTSSRTLLDTYEFNKALRLIGYLTLYQMMNRDQMIAEGAKLRTIQEHERLISDAGICQAVTDDNVMLPPLSVRF